MADIGIAHLKSFMKKENPIASINDISMAVWSFGKFLKKHNVIAKSVREDNILEFEKPIKGKPFAPIKRKIFQFEDIVKGCFCINKEKIVMCFFKEELTLDDYYNIEIRHDISKKNQITIPLENLDLFILMNDKLGEEVNNNVQH